MKAPPSFPWVGHQRAAIWVALAAALAAAFLVHAHHFAFITDDAYISFRYARNFADGHGLVYNVGERVEGYTNFLWVVLVAGLFTMGLDPEVYATIVSRGFSVALLAYLLSLARVRHGRLDAFCFVAVGLLVCNRTFAAWSTGGLETAPFTAAAFIAVAEYGRKDRPGLREGLLFGLTALLRPEGVLFCAIAGLDSAARVARAPRYWKRHLGWSLGFLALFLPYFAWRLWYYGYLLPNTFYAKVPEASGYFERGLPYIGGFFGAYFVLPLVPFAVLASVTGDRAERRHVGLLSAAAAIYLLYVAWVGGDFMEFRFMMPSLPFLYYLAQEGLRRAHGMLVARTGAARLATALAVTVVLGTARGTLAPTFAYEHDPRFGWEIRKLVISTGIQERTGEWLRRYAAAGESIAVSGGGVGPYRAGLYAVEVHGLTDAHIAHAPLARRGMVGHERWVDWDYLAQKRITYVLAARGLKTFTAEPLALADVVSVRRDEGTWLNFKTFEPIDALRLRLQRRGATVLLHGDRTVLFDFEDGSYDGWERTGDAFDRRPASTASPGVARGAGWTGRHFASSGAGGVRETGALLSPEFRVRGKQIQLRVGGGHDPERLVVALLVGGDRVLSSTGRAASPRTELWNVEPFEGRTARILIRDDSREGQGYIAVDDIVLVTPPTEYVPGAAPGAGTDVPAR
jgi:hypothetical protein